MVDVQAILYASLTVSLFSAFLAMLGKQWLNRYASTDMRGSAVERSQNRQRKLDGIVAWYFDSVMESLPLMLQIALLLLGCALSRYLWEISIIIASVVLGVTSFGVLFYVFIVIAGAVSEGCPYQTPGSQAIRHLVPKVSSMSHSVALAIISVPSVIRSALGSPFRKSEVINTIITNLQFYRSWRSEIGIAYFFRGLASELPSAFSTDVRCLGPAAVRALHTLPTGHRRLVRTAHSRLHDIYTSLQQRPNRQTPAPHFRCISWTLQTSLDKPVHLSTLGHLMEVQELAGLDPTLFADCLRIFIGCVNSKNGKVAVIQGSEQLAKMSASCLFLTFHHLLVTDPTSSAVADIRRRYDKIFPVNTDFDGFPPLHPVIGIHALVNQRWSPPNTRWVNYRPSNLDHISSARRMVGFARLGYQRTQNREVPSLTLRFALYSLSLDPLPPASIIADCLTIAAIDMGCDLLDIASWDEGYVCGFHGDSCFSPSTSAQVGHISDLITQKLRSMVEDADLKLIHSKNKAISTVLLYSVFLEQGRHPAMLDAVLDAFRASNLRQPLWNNAQLYICSLLNRPNHPSLHRVIILTSPHVDWDSRLCDESMVSRWVAATSAVAYTDAVGQSVVDTLLQIAAVENLRPHIPVEVWTWLKKQPSLPPICRGREWGTKLDIVRRIRELGDIEILKSYFLLVWSEWDWLDNAGLDEMKIAISEDFGGIGMWCHRKDLIGRVDYVLGQLEQGWEFLHRRNSSINEFRIQIFKADCGKLKKQLLEVDGKATENLTRMSPQLTHPNKHTVTDSHGCTYIGSRSTFSCALPLS